MSTKNIKPVKNRIYNIPLKKIGIIILIIVILIVVFEALIKFFPKQQSSLNEAPKFIENIPGKSENNPLSSPFGIAYMKKGLFKSDKIYVSDTGNNRIKVFDTDGYSLDTFSFPLQMIKKKKVMLPISITLDDKGLIYLTEARSSEIYIFKANGIFSKFLKTKNNLKKPVGVIFSKGKLYVSDIGDHKVKVFNQEGKLLFKIGKQGSEPGNFRFPVGIAIDESGNIYVADTGNRRVQVFSSRGKFKTAIGGGDISVIFNLPRSIAIDSLGRIHVVDTAANKVFVFSKKYKYLFSYGKIGTGKGVLGYPNAIAIDKESQIIYITEQNNNRVSVWEY